MKEKQRMKVALERIGLRVSERSHWWTQEKMKKRTQVWKDR